MLASPRRLLPQHSTVGAVYILTALAFGYATYVYLGPEHQIGTLLAQMQWQALLIPLVLIFVVLYLAPVLYLGSTTLLFLRCAALWFHDRSRATKLAGRIVLIGWAVYLLSWLTFAVGLAGILGPVAIGLVFNVIHSYGVPIIFLSIASGVTYYARERLASGVSI